jgi:predicted molibdopterin-dependent oxidoreductase YjgC
MVVASQDFINIEEYAALSLRHRPNTEVALLNGLMHIILEQGLEDRAGVVKDNQGFISFRNVIDRYKPEYVADATGLTVESLYQAADIFGHNRPTAVIWSVNLSDPKAARGNVHSLVNLQLLLGNFDRTGGGLTPLRSQNNSQGASDMGASPFLLPGYLPITSEEARNKFETAWGVSIPLAQGLTAHDILDAACQGQLKALYILGEDIINTSPEAAQVRRALEACELVILQEIMPSETTRYTDILLPGVSFAEKSGTFTSTERRVQLVNQAIEPIGSSRPDWAIITDLARRLMSDTAHQMEAAPFSNWDYANTAQIMQEIAELTPCYDNIKYHRIQESSPVFWPIPKPAPHFIPAEQAPLETAPSPILNIA